MSKQEYGYSKKVDLSFEDAITKVTEELKKEGFGILAEIDVKATLKKKINADIDNYMILGACNPPNAYKAVQAEIEIGLLLPCNVIVYEKDNEVFVSAISPTLSMSIVDNDDLPEIAQTIEKKLRTAIDKV